MLPFSAPKRRRPRGSTGTSRTTGTFPRVMITSPGESVSDQQGQVSLGIMHRELSHAVLPSVDIR